MKDVIKRAFVPTYVDNESIEDILKESLFKEWYTEVKNKNRMFYRFGNRMNSYVVDALVEQDIMISKFSYELLDITKPYYAILTTGSPVIDSRVYRRSNETDDLISDLYYIGKRINTESDIKLENKERLQSLFNRGLLSHITQDDIDSSFEFFTPEIIAIKALDEGEYILSGEIHAATSNGKVVSFGERETSPGLFRSSDLSEGSVVADDSYILLDPFTVLSSIVIKNSSNGNTVEVSDIGSLVVGRFEATNNYSNIYDIDKDGYISAEDVIFLKNAIGITTNNVSEVEWKEKYASLDNTRDGIISSSDVDFGIINQGALREDALIIRNPIESSVTVEFEFHNDPFTTYFNGTEEVRGGTFGIARFFELEGIDIRIADGYVRSSTNIVIGINIAENQVHAGREFSGGWGLNKVNYPDSDRMLIRGITRVDDIAFILLQGENGFKYRDLTDIAIVRFDMRREVIEVSLDMIPILGIELEPEDILSALISTDRKDIFRIFTVRNNFYTIKMEQSSLVDADRTYGSQGLEDYMDPSDIIRKIKLYNDLDNFAFNFGLKRPFKNAQQSRLP